MGQLPCTSSLSSSTVVARLEVSSPRRPCRSQSRACLRHRRRLIPCSRVDQRFGRTFTEEGVRAEAARTGSAGIMLRVLQEGSVAVGDVMRVTQRPHTQWSVHRVAELLYGHPTACMTYAARDVKLSEWKGSVEELRQVCVCLCRLSSLPHHHLCPACLAVRVASAC